MLNIIKIAGRNLRRYQRRTILTTALITLGVMAVLLFISITGSFKDMMVGQITDSMLGHIQIHRKGYLSSIDSLPLDRNLNQRQVAKVKKILSGVDSMGNRFGSEGLMVLMLLGRCPDPPEPMGRKDSTCRLRK